jgi:threonine/homoserine/homoserine lactone efflux protein
MKERMASTPSAGQRSGACHERASPDFRYHLACSHQPRRGFRDDLAQQLPARAPRGMLAALGVAISCWFHVFYAVFGLTVMERLFPHLLNIVKIAGAAYLVYVGAATALARPAIRARVLASQRIFNAAIGAVLVLLGTALALFDASHALDG